MGQTRDRTPGPSIEEETQYEDRTADGDPTASGAIRRLGDELRYKEASALSQILKARGYPAGFKDVDLTGVSDQQILKYDATSKTIIPGASAGGGESNLGANVGTGADVFRDKTGVTLNFRGLNPINVQNLLTAAVNADNIDLNVLHDSAFWNALKLKGKEINDTGLGDDYVLRYDSGTSQWKVETLGEAPTVSDIMQLMVNIHDFVLSTTYQVIGEPIIFGGSTNWGTPIEILVLHAQTGDVTRTHQLRLFDVTNGLTIAESASFNNLIDQIDTMGAISNVPAGQAIWEMQGRRGGGGNKLHLGTFSIRSS